MRRASAIGLALSSVLMGVGLGSSTSGCVLCDCERLEPVRTGTFTAVESTRAELDGALVLVDEDAGVEISYTLDDGSTWVATYDVVAMSP